MIEAVVGYSLEKMKQRSRGEAVEGIDVALAKKAFLKVATKSHSGDVVGVTTELEDVLELQEMLGADFVVEARMKAQPFAVR